MASVIVNPNLPITVALAKFKKAVEQEGIMRELKKREHHVKPSVAKREKSREARANLKKLNKKRKNYDR